MIAIVDYGMGNVASVRNALALLGVEGKVTSHSGDFEAATHIILPGVGAFADGMAELDRRGVKEILNREVKKQKKPFLGICLGMELLGTSGDEGGETEGLNFIEGRVEWMEVDESKFRLPHIGWNSVSFVSDSPLLEGIPESDFYFVHSYVLKAKHQSDVIATCEYDMQFAAIVQHENIFGTQFHPEKSQKNGLALLRNFVNFHA